MLGGALVLLRLSFKLPRLLNVGLETQTLMKSHKFHKVLIAAALMTIFFNVLVSIVTRSV